MSRHSLVNKFVDQVMQVSPSIGTDGDPFAYENREYLVEVRDAILKTIDETPITEYYRTGERQEGDAPVLYEMITHWQRWYSNLAYRKLADSINVSFGASWGRLAREAQANAYYQWSSALRTWIDIEVLGRINVEYRP